MVKTRAAFIKTVYAFYERHGRQRLPWRLTSDPYRILVSEIMLQQTQVDRVVGKYQSFLKRFPSLKTLANATLGDVLREWQGLGYNRRAKLLHECAKEIMQNHRGEFPRSFEALKVLPGIGPYTAGAVMAFAYNTPTPIIETNIRTVYLHHFFSDHTDVPDSEIMTLIRETLDLKDPRQWYAALMDYGSYIKRTHGNPNSKSRHYTKQSTFKGSDREIRGAIEKQLGNGGCTRKKLHAALPFDMRRIDEQLTRLLKEDMIKKRRSVYELP